MARPVLPRPGLAVRAAALHPAPLSVFPGLAELPDFSKARLRAPPSPRVFPGLAAGPATLLLPSPPRPARRRLSGLFGPRRSAASLSAVMAWADAPLLCSGFRAGQACGDRNPTPADLELRSSSLTSAEVQLPQSLAQVDNYRYKPLKLECPVAGISVDLSQLSLPLQ
ncbi:putative uncharacterized protein DANCR [Piliocolobus tephrosceles]|uniref:putative uncharacterized protein DANCR n=1 Tax=Piliocolobus tephrosceles TaxID=591936 RepID=UPI000C295A43|nr:putative uncharacterized protein DANCR [Piliocolobus tephrosceles]